MNKQLGFFGLLSAGIMGRDVTTDTRIGSLLLEEQSTLVRLLNQYQSLFDRLDTLARESKPKETQVTPGSLPKQYAALLSYYQEEIEDEKCYHLNRHFFSKRYYNLLKKYEQKINRTNLSPRQRRIYEKLYNQYSDLYKEYRDNI